MIYDPTSTADSEEQVLGYMLCLDTALARGVAQLQAWHFSAAQAKSLFEILTDLHRQGGLACAARLQESWVRLRSVAHLEARTASQYLARLMERCGAHKHAHALDWHIARIREATKRRSVLELAVQAADAARDPGSDVLESVRGALEEVMARGRELSDVPLIGRTAAQHIEQRVEPEKPPVRIPIGVSALDTYLGGYEPGELIVISATPGAGKSAIAIQTAATAASRGASVAMFSLEIAANQITYRVAASTLGIPLSSVYNGTVDREQRRALVQFANEVSEWKLAVYDHGSLKMSDIERMCDSQRSQMGLDLVIVDLLGLVQSANPRENRSQQLAEVAYGLKRLAKTLNVCVIATVQLNRQAGESMAAGMALIKDSGGPAEAADLVMVLADRKWEQNEQRGQDWRPITIKLDKVRRADRRSFAVAFDGRFQRFVTPEIGNQSNSSEDF